MDSTKNKRRSFLKASLISVGGTLISLTSLSRSLTNVNMQEKKEPIKPDLVHEFVVAGHLDLDVVEEVLNTLKGKKYRLVMATKGDLLDQERKLKKSGLEHYFHHIEIMSDKREDDYKKLIKHLDISPSQFLMIGNSLKSDVLPVLNIGGHGIHVPFHITWAHETIETKIEHVNFHQAENIRHILNLIN